MAQPNAFKPEPNSFGRKIAIGATAALVVGAVVVYSYRNNKPTANADTSLPSPSPRDTTTADTPTITPAAQAASSAMYRDGSYTQAVSYRTPESSETIQVTLTLKHDIVTAVIESGSGTNRESLQYQNRFASSFKSSVIGKNIANLNLDRVSGASLTTAGFNQALQNIAGQASGT